MRLRNLRAKSSRVSNLPNKNFFFRVTSFVFQFSWNVNFYFILVCLLLLCLLVFQRWEGWFRGWIAGIYILVHLLCINFFHRTIWIFKDSSFPPPPSPPLPLPPPPPHIHTATTTFKVSARDLGWHLKPRHYEILKSQHRSRYFHLHVHLLVHCWYEVETILSSANVQSVERCSEKTWGEFTLQSLSLSLPHFSTNSTCKKVVFVNSNQ